MGIGKWPEPVVLLLSGGIPEAEVDHFAIDFDGSGVVIEDGGDVLGGEAVLGVAGLW